MNTNVSLFLGAAALHSPGGFSVTEPAAERLPARLALQRRRFPPSLSSAPSERLCVQSARYLPNRSHHQGDPAV